MKDSTFRDAFNVLFTEAFEGIRPGASGTWFVEKQECLLLTAASLSAEQASHRPNSKTSSIAAHLDHTRYYMSLANAYARKESPQADWEGSWRRQKVSDAEWKQICEDLKNEYEQLKRHAAEADLENEEVVTAVMANLAHAAYHLGAVQQLVRLI